MACSCDNNAVGVWVCDGAGNCTVLTPPAGGGVWFPIRDSTNGTWSYYNLGAIVDLPGEGLRTTPPAPKKKKTAPKKKTR